MELEELRDNFYTALEGLKEVHTQEELDNQKKIIESAKAKLFDVDEEFRAMLERNKRAAQSRIKSERSEHDYSGYDNIRSDAMMRADTIRREAQLRKLGKMDFPEEKFKISTFEKIKAANSQELICPICKGPDRGNMINEKPYCFNCRHELVPRSELKNYNREYRRKWKKNK